MLHLSSDGLTVYLLIVIEVYCENLTGGQLQSSTCRTILTEGFVKS